MFRFAALFSILLLTVLNPARSAAQEKYLFGGTGVGDDWILTVNSTTEITSGDTGWTDNVGSHFIQNYNYLAGSCEANCGNRIYRNWALFDLGGLSVGTAISSARLKIYIRNRTLADPIDFQLFDILTNYADLDQTRADGDSIGLEIFDDLGSGQSYGETLLSLDDLSNAAFVYLDFNDAGRAALAASAGHAFLVGGSVPDATLPSAIPEPTTWSVWVLGLAVAGAVLRRKRVVKALSS